MSKHYILMGDIIKSAKHDGQKLMESFKGTVNHINEVEKSSLLSPLTITLGDEFQGIPNSLLSSIQTIISIEEAIIHRGISFKLRYVVYHGKIATEINKNIAYEMVGEGLTKSRERIEKLKHKRKRRFDISLPQDEYLGVVLNLLFLNYGSIIDDWSPKDFRFVSEFLKHRDYKVVAQNLKRDESSTFRRKDSLKIAEYVSCKALLLLLGRENSKLSEEKTQKPDNEHLSRSDLYDQIMALI